MNSGVAQVPFVFHTESSRDPLTITWLSGDTPYASNEFVTARVLREPYRVAPEVRERWRDLIGRHARLRHPSLVRTLGVATEQPDAWVTLRPRGTKLDQFLRGPRLPQDVALHIAWRILLALGEGAAAGLVHHDLSPQNVTITRAGEILLGEFGIWRVIPTRERAHLRFDAGLIGYDAPELLEQEVGDTRADVFAVGVMLYEMLSGAHPFRARSPVETSFAIVTGQYRPLRSVEPTVSEDIADYVSLLLGRDPTQRFQSPTAAANALASLASERITEEKIAALFAERTMRSEAETQTKIFARRPNPNERLASSAASGGPAATVVHAEPSTPHGTTASRTAGQVAEPPTMPLGSLEPLGARDPQKIPGSKAKTAFPPDGPPLLNFSSPPPATSPLPPNPAPSPAPARSTTGVDVEPPLLFAPPSCPPLAAGSGLPLASPLPETGPSSAEESLPSSAPSEEPPRQPAQSAHGPGKERFGRHLAPPLVNDGTTMASMESHKLTPVPLPPAHLGESGPAASSDPLARGLYIGPALINAASPIVSEQEPPSLASPSLKALVFNPSQAYPGPTQDLAPRPASIEAQPPLSLGQVSSHIPTALPPLADGAAPPPAIWDSAPRSGETPPSSMPSRWARTRVTIFRGRHAAPRPTHDIPSARRISPGLVVAIAFASAAVVVGIGLLIRLWS